MPSLNEMAFRKLATISTAATLALITLGAVVRSTDSGLGCADHWPGCNGSAIPDFTNHHVMIEFSHRVVAGIVVLLIAGLTVSAFRRRSEHPNLFTPCFAALMLVLFQAGLGAVVVKLDLDAESVVLHMVTAVSLLALLIYIVALATPDSPTFEEPPAQEISKMARWSAGGVLFLMAVGSYLSGVEGGGRAFNDWPLMDGKLIPDLAVEEKAVHFFHRGVAAVVGAFVIIAMLRIIKEKGQNPSAAKVASFVLLLFGIEVLIGAFNVWLDLNPAVVTLHLLAGATMWGCLVGMGLITSPKFRTRVSGAQNPVRARPAITHTR